jgi:YVTN family beta-propeller protein
MRSCHFKLLGLVGTATFFALLAATAAELNHPTGTKGVMMVDKYGAKIRFFDPVNLSEISNFDVPKNPHDFVLSADHKLAYVPIYGDGVYGKNPNPGHEVVIVDLEGRKLAGTIDIAPHRAPHGIQIGQDGKLYVTCDLDRQVLMINPQTRAIEATLEAEGTGHWIGLLPDGSKIYITNKTDKPFISVIDLKTRKIVNRIPAPNGTEGVAVSPDGKRVIVMESQEAAMLVIDPATDKITDRILLKGQTKGYKVYLSPDGKKLITMSIAEDVISIFDPTNLHKEPVTLPVGKDPMGFAFSADGRTLLVANHGDGSVSVVDLAKSKVVKTFQAGTAIETLTYY